VTLTALEVQLSMEITSPNCIPNGMGLLSPQNVTQGLVKVQVNVVKRI
jgi:hypothetical protein